MSKNFVNIIDLGGLRTDLLADKIPLRNASDVANMDFSIRGLAQTRKGYDTYGNTLTALGSCLRSFLYKKNYGTAKRIKLRVRDDGTNSILEWHNASNTSNSEGKWETLVAGLTTGAVMGFTPFNNTNANLLVFCNAINNYSTWNGATATVASVTTNTIVANETLASEGFSVSGTVIVDGTTYTYSGTSAKTFTGVTPDPTTQAPIAGVGIAQSPDITTYSANPKGNILITSAARVWLSGVPTRESQLYYSSVADATDFSAGSNPDDAGIEDFPDGGGAITLLDSKDNQKIIIHKKDAILQFVLEYTATAKIPKLDVLTLADDCGATNLKAGAGLNQASYFPSTTEILKSIARAVDSSDLNLTTIGDIILPTVENYDNSNACAVYYAKKGVIYVSTKKSTNSYYNDVVVAFYIKRDSGGNFDVDISVDDGLFVADWMLDGKDLYYVSSLDQNTYKMFVRKSDRGKGIKHKWVSKEMVFDDPSLLKEFNTIYIEGLIASRTKIKITVLYGLLGNELQLSKTLEWDNSSYVSAKKVGALGTEVIGTASIGASNDDIQDSYPFSVPIHFDINPSTRFKIQIETLYDDETQSDCYWAISNIALNPTKKGIEQNKIINVNL